MTSLTANLRKAAILIRSLDADTAATVLARLAPAEAKAVRLAIQAIGEIDPEERADVSAEFRRSGSVAQEDPRRGVELDLSSSSLSAPLLAPVDFKPPAAGAPPIAARPFEFLEQARVESLVPYLSREHAQTVAVVLSYLAPARAAQILAALPEKLQADAIDRLSTLGETDPSSLQVLERELADWVLRQQSTRSRPTQRTDTVAAILAAAEPATRREILANLVKHNRSLASQIAPSPPKPVPAPTMSEQIADCGMRIADLKAAMTAPIPTAPPLQSPIRNPQPKIPSIPFDDVERLDKPTLTAVLKAVDAEVLVLSLVGASEALVGRITELMPGKIAKTFRQRLHGCGPTRLRDVEAAQQAVASAAAEILHARRNGLQTVAT